MDSKPSPHVVVIGAGFGGLLATRTLARYPVRVTLIDRKNFHTFQPLLYQVATAGLSPGEIAAPIRWILRGDRNVQVLMGEVQDLDLARKVVKLGDGDISYDYLIVAAGASHSYFGHSEWEPLAPGLKTLDDALEMRRRVLLAFEAAEREREPERQRRLLTFVIVGAGPTGVELAGALGEIARQSLAQDFRSIRPESARIVLVEGGAHVLPPFPDRLRDAARRDLERLRVEVRTGTMATVGRGAAVGEIFGLEVSGFLAWLFWIFLHVFWLIGFRNRIVVMTEWAFAFLTFQRRVRLITGEPAAFGRARARL